MLTMYLRYPAFEKDETRWRAEMDIEMQLESKAEKLEGIKQRLIAAMGLVREDGASRYRNIIAGARTTQSSYQ